MENEKKKVQIEIYRKDGNTIFKFKVDPRITNYFKENSTEIRESQSWVGLKFYVCPEIQQDREYTDALYNAQLYDDFGVGLTQNRMLNIAWIRSVEGEGEIVVKGNPTFASLSTLFRSATTFLKGYFENVFREFKIKGTLSIEL